MDTSIIPTTAVCIPWRKQNERLPAFERVENFWRTFGFDITTADSDPSKPFNISQARNIAVEKSCAATVIVADADTIPDIANVLAALEQPTDTITWPFTEYRHLPAWAVAESDLAATQPTKRYKKSWGGLFITTAETYWHVGAMDERFQGWGYEDNAFHAAASTFATVQRMPGTVYSFDTTSHDDRMLGRDNANYERNSLYQNAFGNVSEMRELVTDNVQVMI